MSVCPTIAMVVTTVRKLERVYEQMCTDWLLDGLDLEVQAD